MILIHDKYDEFEVELLLSVNSSYQRHLLMARVLFPSFYFDCYEDIINGIENEDSSATIYYDENGVLIKKEVKVNETDSSKTKEIITIKTK